MKGKDRNRRRCPWNIWRFFRIFGRRRPARRPRHRPSERRSITGCARDGFPIPRPAFPPCCPICSGRRSASGWQVLSAAASCGRQCWTSCGRGQPGVRTCAWTATDDYRSMTSGGWSRCAFTAVCGTDSDRPLRC